jgi:hypothetical protein
MDLGRRGCQGTPRDFAAWVHFETGVEDPSVPAVLENLVSAGKFKHHPGFDHEYILASPIEFPASVRYKVSGELKQSPIQMVRSCMEAFLRSQGTADETLMDISIATTEAMEEPMLKNRFVVTFIANKEIEIPSYLICEINLPKFIKREWQEISISIRNMLNTKILKELKRMLNEEVVVMAIQIL